MWCNGWCLYNEIEVKKLRRKSQMIEDWQLWTFVAFGAGIVAGWFIHDAFNLREEVGK